MYHKKSFVFLIFILLSNLLVKAQLYADPYADLTFEINEKGVFLLNQKTNDINLMTKINEQNIENLTLKYNAYWLFNLTENKEFSNYFIEIILPENIEINYIKSNSSFRLTKDKIYFIGEKKPIEILIQYRFLRNNEIDETKNSLFFYLLSLKPHQSIILFILFFSIFMFLLSFFFFLIKTISNKLIEKVQQIYLKKEFKKKIDFILTEQQKEIINILKNEKKPLTQKEIQLKLNMAKSTLSRNIDILRQKGIIEKEQKGMSNIILLNEKYKSL